MKSIAFLLFGIVIGIVEENIRYSIIHHEAKKGDEEAQRIVDEFDVVGQKIEDAFNKTFEQFHHR